GEEGRRACLYRRRDGGTTGRPRRQSGQSRSARRAGLYLPGGKGSDRRESFQGNRAAVQGRLVPLRPQFRRHAGKTSVGGGGVRHGRAESARGAGTPGGSADDREHAGRQDGMSVVLGILAALLVAVGLVAAFLRADASRLAGTLRLAGPAVLAIAGVVLTITGRAGLGGMLLSGAFAWYGFGRAKGRVAKPKGQRSTVRTAALEMERDHDTGGLEGMVLAGSHEQKMLSSMTLRQLKELYRELADDSESRQLLER